jgi:hypothetical protein
MGLLVLYCLKGNGPMKKLTAGGLYIYWSQHFYQLGSYLGVIVNLPCRKIKKKIIKKFNEINANALFIKGH